MMGGGSPATFSQGGNPAPYVPTAQPQADTNFQSIIQQLMGAAGPAGINTPAGQNFPQAQAFNSQFLTGSGPTFGNTTPILDAMGGANMAYQLGNANAPALSNAGLNILQTGFDPQQALFNRTQNQVLDQSNVANAAAGLGSSPYGASVTGNNLANFDINWQNQQLGREAQAAGTALPLLQGASGLAASSGAAPFNAASTIAGNTLSGLSGASNLGMQQYTLPQTILNDLESYLGLGQSASNLAANTGQMGFNQLAQGVGGAVSGISGLSNLFGGGSGAASSLGGLGGASIGLPGITDAGALPAGVFGSVGGGGDLGALLAPTTATVDAGATAGGGLLSALPFS